MDVTEILKKVIDEQALSGEERKLLSEFRPQGIPKGRLDAEIAKRKDLEQKNNELNKTLGEVSFRVDELENRDLSESEKLEKNYSVELKRMRDNIASLTTEKNSSKDELEQIRFQQQVNKLASEKKFGDSGYLGFLLKKANISPNESGQVEEFMTELRDSSPKLFRLELRSGSGSNPGGHEMEFSSAKQSGNIDAMLANAPEVIN
jgi:hypothetical protein